MDERLHDKLSSFCLISRRIGVFGTILPLKYNQRSIEENNGK